MGVEGGRVLLACAEQRRRDRVVSAFTATDDRDGPAIETVAGAEKALSRLSDADCLVVGDELADGEPLDLVTDARARVADLPIIIYAREVVPSLANVTSETDRTGFLYDDGDGSDEVLVERVLDAVDRRPDAAILAGLRDHLPMAVYVKDAEGRYLWMVDVEDGHDPDTSIGKTDLEVLDDERLARRAYEDDMRVIETGEPIIAKEERLVGPDYDLWLETTKIPWTDDDGTVRGLVGVTLEIDEKKQLQQEIEKQRERIERFASFISHDLRNPLNVAKGYLELARDEDDPPDSHYGEIEEALERIEEIVDDAVAMAREDSVLSFADQPVIGDVVREAWSMLDTDGASLEVDMPDEARIYAGASQLQQLFENLFRNAVEHGRRDPSAPLSVEVGLDGEGFYVMDDGVGIPSDRREEVLEYGYTRGGGTGTGLAIVSEIVDLYGWTIDVTESPDGGARFEVDNCLLVRHPELVIESGVPVDVETSVDVGDPRPGSTRREEGGWTIEGAGEDVWGEAEGHHYAYATIEGDARIQARVLDLDGVHEFSKAGVMLRAGLDTGEPLAHTGLTGSHGSEVIWRPDLDAPIWSKFPDDDATAPYWYRVDRVGDVVTCSLSADGERWHPLDQRELDLEDPIHLGLVVCSHDPNTTATGRFDEVSVHRAD